jgi:hypothetical protein
LSIESILAELTEARQQQRKQAAIVDAELRSLRREKLSGFENQTAIIAARAYNAGARMIDIKTALETTDHGTARRLIEDGEVLINALGVQLDDDEKLPEVPEQRETLATLNSDDNEIYIQGTMFEIIEMDEQVMLSTTAPLYPNGYDQFADPVVKEYDGFIFPVGVKTDEHRAIQRLLLGAGYHA